MIMPANTNDAPAHEVAAGLTRALTIIIAGIHDPGWLLEYRLMAVRVA